MNTNNNSRFFDKKSLWLEVIL